MTTVAVGASEAGGSFEGVWKKCYEPGLAGVDEPDSGYLILMPDRKYFEISSACCSGKASSMVSSYSASDTTVSLVAKRENGSSYTLDLQHRRIARVVFFDNLKGAPVVTEALTPGEDLNYAWCKVFPISD